MHVSSAVDVGNMAREPLSLWSDLATHYVALRWHRVAAARPRGWGNILPGMQSGQNQHIVKSVQPLVALDMCNDDGFTMATTQSRSNEQP